MAILCCKHVGRLLRKFRRGGNLVSRTGGEEFEVVLINTSTDTVLEVAENIRALLESTPPSKLELLTASIGVAVSREDDTYKTLRKRADEGAYVAKQAGRNKVCMVDDD